MTSDFYKNNLIPMITKITLNTVNTYFLSMGLKTDLVSDTYILPKTSEELFD